ncbi:interleukin-17 receptor A isoform X2 [Myripristis murdjan]|uniref:interleukin-17 receptor A isoform X2 n=1 Tax=Myripristis murdjan TaxID=586833 RepID=UPI0011764671|nr:interleukin-17 receptor A-like isoform X2 [Myripristis murdjan]
MIHVLFLIFYLAAGATRSSSLRILGKHLDCSQQVILCSAQIKNCSDKRMVVPRHLAPTQPEWGPEHVGVGMDEHGLLPIMNVTWKISSNAGVYILNGSEIHILDGTTNQSMCVQYSFKISAQLDPSHNKWTFSLDGVMVDPWHTYSVSVFNLPVPDTGHDRISKRITIPGCDDWRIQKAQICLENGSLWDPHMTGAVSVDKGHKTMSVTVGFDAAKYSERYQVSIQSHGFNYSKSVSKENRTSLNVTFELGIRQLSQCEIIFEIQPFFRRCKDNCLHSKKIFNYCLYPAKTSSPDAKEEPKGFQVQGRKRVLIIYSLDHPLYKNIILKFCAFLASKCGIEVILDLLDSARLGVLGSVQWFDFHRQQIESSSDKILILCSHGVQAKWKAMCGENQVLLREDALSPVGDMLTPALSLMVPHFVRSASFHKYIVAYFDDICSEEDVPSPFNVTVRYKLMKQFEEVFFRILDIDKHEPGRVNYAEGLADDEYYHCPSGRALQDAIEAFHAYQLQHPNWFEDELVK